MTTSPQLSSSPPSAGKTPSTNQTLRLLFLTLFLRGRSARGLKKETAPKSVGKKLATTLLIYGALGFLALLFRGQPVFAIALYLHAMTFVFLGMFIAASAGEVLFNNEEADILLHRPIEPRTLLWAKVRVLVEVSLWIAGAFNLVGLCVGVSASNGDWRFPLVHALSTILEALFCTSCVVLAYQLCLRWFGRQRLEGLMTTAQILISVAAVLSGQLLPQFLFRAERLDIFTQKSWWLALLPPTWFAGFDDALAGAPTIGAGLLALAALVATAVVLWISFGKLAGDYEIGLQTLSERRSRPARRKENRRWLDILLTLPPLRWWLRDPVSRASFLLVAAYLVRDRDVKLRLYPGIAPMLIVPIIFLVRGHDSGGFGNSGFGAAFTFAYLGLVPLLAINILQYSQQYQASDIFRAAPILGPARIGDGARRAVLFLLTLPVMIFFAVIAFISNRDPAHLFLLLPGLIALPVFALVPMLGGAGIPLSLPTEEAKSAGRGMSMIVAMFCSLALAGLAAVAWSTGWFWWLVLVETLFATLAYVMMRRLINSAPWPSLD